MKPFSMLVKPASADCNLRCDYCFYLDKRHLYPNTSVHRMDQDTLENLINSYMKTNQHVYNFGWQGGEPTLMGIDFFRQAVDLQYKNIQKGKSISNSFQTNCTLIDDDWAEFLSRHKFLVGVSLDGPELLHNHFRKNGYDKGSYSSVMKGIRKLKQYGTEFNTLTLVSRANVNSPLEVYRFLRDEVGCRHHQYIECVEFNDKGNLLPFAINANQWGQFLCDIFEEWITKDTQRVSIRLFDSILSKLLYGTNELCTSMPNCNHYLVAEFNGDIYPCDFYVEPTTKLGNLNEVGLSEVLSSETYKKFGIKKVELNKACLKCKFVSYCVGDCLKNRHGRGVKPGSISALCEGWKQFYEYSLPMFKKITQKLKGNLIKNQLVLPRTIKIGRNDYCPCGSGKKYKHCCMQTTHRPHGKIYKNVRSKFHTNH